MPSRIKQAREKIEGLRLALLSPTPEDIGAALPGLEDAALCLEQVEREIREGACSTYELRRDLKLLKNDLRISVRLIENGMAFCQGWAKMIGATPAYTQSGESAPTGAATSLSIQG